MVTEDSVMLVIRASRPNFRNNHDKLAFAVHASFLASGFVLISTGPPAFDENSLSSSSPSEEVGIEQWNELDEEYAFVYKNPKKDNKKVLVKCLVMGDKLMVDAVTDGASEPAHLDINVGDYVTETATSDYHAQYKNLGKLVSSLESDVLSKLVGSSAGDRVTGLSRPSTVEEPDRSADEPTLQEPSLRGRVDPPVIPVGGGDLFPSPGAGMYPTRGDFGGGSMLLGPNDPRWYSGGGVFAGHPGPDVGGPPDVPPGARYDPIGPPGVPGFEPDRFGRYPRGPNPGRGRGNRTPGRIHPDLEQPGSGGFDDYI